MPLFSRWRRLPALARDLPSNVAQAEAAFDKRIKERFPAGTPENQLIAELKHQGFDRLASARDEEGDWHDATFYRRRFPFTTLWSVRWRAAAGRVDRVWGVHGIRAP